MKMQEYFLDRGVCQKQREIEKIMPKIYTIDYGIMTETAGDARQCSNVEASQIGRAQGLTNRAQCGNI